MPDLSKMNKTTGKPMPHIGEKIIEVMQKKYFTNAELARRINIHPIGVTRYLRQDTMHAALLWKIGQVLNFNFFEWLAEEFPPVQLDNEEKLQLQIEELQKENELYKKMLEK